MDCGKMFEEFEMVVSYVCYESFLVKGKHHIYFLSFMKVGDMRKYGTVWKKKYALPERGFFL